MCENKDVLSKDVVQSKVTFTSTTLPPPRLSLCCLCLIAQNKVGLRRHRCHDRAGPGRASVQSDMRAVRILGLDRGRGSEVRAFFIPTEQEEIKVNSGGFVTNAYINVSVCADVCRRPKQRIWSLLYFVFYDHFQLL